jgi:hydrogenase-4 component F
VALLGLPPFSLFASERAIARAGFAQDMGWVAAAAFALVLVAFAALAARTGRMVLGGLPPAPGTPAVPLRVGPATALPWLAGLLACAALGMATGPLTDVLSQAATIVAGGR